MWQRNAWFAACVLAHAAALYCPAPCCFAQDPRIPVPSTDLGLTPPLPTQCPAVRFELVMGRLTAVHLSAGNQQVTRENEPECGLRESLHIQCEGKSSRVRYERLTPSEITHFEITDGDQVSIRKQSTVRAEDRSMDLRQTSNGVVEVICLERGRERQIRATSFWHLLLAERSWCEQELVPLLQQLRSNWDLLESADRVEQALYRAANTGHTVARARLEELVAELACPNFQRRQSADRALRALGPTVLCYLAGLDANQLNVEQRRRILHIQQSMSHAAADTPERVALWLVDDEQVWVALLSHPDAEKRHLAMLQLMEIRPEAANFDPYGDDHYRQQQLDQLRLVLNAR